MSKMTAIHKLKGTNTDTFSRMQITSSDNLVSIIESNVKTSMAVEGIRTVRRTDRIGRRYLNGKIGAQEAIEIIKSMYSKSR